MDIAERLELRRDDGGAAVTVSDSLLRDAAEEIRQMWKSYSDACEVIKDATRLDWLEKQTGGGIISDDAGRWAFPTGGHQPLVVDEPLAGAWSFYLEVEDWKPSIREAIDNGIETMGERI